jgi:hypothetical protein
MERAARMRPEKIQPGDVWTLTLNNDVVVRHVRSVTHDGVVTYDINGKLFQCRLITFRQWARDAELTSREGWFAKEREVVTFRS